MAKFSPDPVAAGPAIRGFSGGGFSGKRSIRPQRAKTPNTTSQKDEAIQPKRMTKRPRMIPSRRVKPSIWNTPTIRVTAATVQARTRKR